MTIKSNSLVFSGVVQSSGSIYHTTYNTDLQAIVDARPGGTPLAVRQYVAAGNLFVDLWVGQRIDNGYWTYYFPGGWTYIQPTSGYYTWYPATIQITSGSYLGQDITLEITLSNPAPVHPDTTPPTAVTTKVNGNIVSSNYSQNSSVGTTSWISGEPTWVFLPDYTPSSPFSFPGSSDGLVQIASSQSADFTTTITGKRTAKGSASLSADFTVIAAPGRIKLAAADITAEVFVEDPYIDPAYFGELYVYGGELASLTLRPILTLSADTAITATLNQSFNGAASLAVDSTLQEVSGYLKSLSSTQSADFTQTGLGGIVWNGQSDFTTDATLTATAQVTHSQTTQTLSADTDQTALGGMLYDIGVNYAYDWATDYYSPESHLTLVTDSSLYAAGTVEVIIGANISAEASLGGLGGLLYASGNLILSADSTIVSQPFSLTGGTGVIFRPSSIIASDFATQILGTRRFNIIQTLSADFSTFADPLSRIYATAGIACDSTLTITPKLILSSTSFWTADTDVYSNAGFLRRGAAGLTVDSNLIGQARLLVIDEYYIDHVSPELRIATILFDARTNLDLDFELRRITPLFEQRQALVLDEPRINTPEVGPPYLVGRRTRRLTV